MTQVNVTGFTVTRIQQAGGNIHLDAFTLQQIAHGFAHRFLIERREQQVAVTCRE